MYECIIHKKQKLEMLFVCLIIQTLNFCCFSCLVQIEREVCYKVDFWKTDKTKAFDQLNRF